MVTQDDERTVDDVRAIYDDQTEEEFRAGIYRELEWIRHEKEYASGWTGVAYKKLYGIWPELWMHGLAPREPREDLVKWVNRQNARYGRKKKRERGSVGTVSRSPRQTKRHPGFAEPDDRSA